MLKIHMEILCALGLSIAAMEMSIAQSASNVIRLDADARAWTRHSDQAPADGDDSFWPEVSSRYALENPMPMNPDNRAGRVLAEIALLFGAIGALIFVIWIFLPGGIFQ